MLKVSFEVEERNRRKITTGLSFDRDVFLALCKECNRLKMGRSSYVNRLLAAFLVYKKLVIVQALPEEGKPKNNEVIPGERTNEDK